MLSVAGGNSRRCKAKYQQAARLYRRFILKTSQLVPNVAAIIVQQPLTGTVGNISPPRTWCIIATPQFPDTVIGSRFCRLDPEFTEIDRIKAPVVELYIRDINLNQSL